MASPRCTELYLTSVWLICSSAILPINAFAHGDLHPRISLLDKSIQSSPGNPELLLQRGELHRLNEEPDLAIMDYSRVLELDPACDQARLGLGLARLNAGQCAEAKSAIEKYLEAHPQNQEAR